MAGQASMSVVKLTLLPAGHVVGLLTMKLCKHTFHHTRVSNMQVFKAVQDEVRTVAVKCCMDRATSGKQLRAFWKEISMIAQCEA